jgi:acetyl esterase/lipase
MIRRTFLAACLALLLCVPLLASDDPQITEDIVYGHKDGMALTFDMMKSANPNGAAVLAIQSGGWYSNYVPPAALKPVMQPLLAKGYTVMIVRHGSAPKYTVPEAIDDVRRCVRFIHLKAGDLGVDANRLGVTGGSAGGHLTLMLATTGDDGDPSAKDPVLKHSSKIAAAVSLFPPTDLRGWTTDPPEAIKRLPQLKPPLTFAAAKEAACSPLLHA